MLTCKDYPVWLLPCSPCLFNYIYKLPKYRTDWNSDWWCLKTSRLRGTVSVRKFVPVYQVDADLFNKLSANFDFMVVHSKHVSHSQIILKPCFPHIYFIWWYPTRFSILNFALLFFFKQKPGCPPYHSLSSRLVNPALVDSGFSSEY